MIWIKLSENTRKCSSHYPNTKDQRLSWLNKVSLPFYFVGNILCVFAVTSRYVNDVNVAQIVASVKGFLINIFLYKVVTTLHTCLNEAHMISSKVSNFLPGKRIKDWKKKQLERMIQNWRSDPFNSAWIGCSGVTQTWLIAKSLRLSGCNLSTLVRAWVHKHPFNFQVLPVALVWWESNVGSNARPFLERPQKVRHTS